MRDDELTSPTKMISYLGGQMVAQDMSKTAIEAWIALGVLLGAVARIYKYRKALLRVGGLGLIGWLVLNDKGAAILEILIP